MLRGMISLFADESSGIVEVVKPLEEITWESVRATSEERLDHNINKAMIVHLLRLCHRMLKIVFSTAAGSRLRSGIEEIEGNRKLESMLDNIYSLLVDSHSELIREVEQDLERFLSADEVAEDDGYDAADEVEEDDESEDQADDRSTAYGESDFAEEGEEEDEEEEE